MWYNPLISWLLRSPFHGMISRGILLISVTGKKSGKSYTTPVNYLRDGSVLWVVSKRERTWWRNLIGGAPVKVLLEGRALEARAGAIKNENDVAASLTAYFQKAPQYAKFYKVGFSPAGQPVASDIDRAAQEWVMIRIDLAT